MDSDAALTSDTSTPGQSSEIGEIDDEIRAVQMQKFETDAKKGQDMLAEALEETGRGIIPLYIGDPEPFMPFKFWLRMICTCKIPLDKIRVIPLGPPEEPEGLKLYRYIPTPASDDFKEGSYKLHRARYKLCALILGELLTRVHDPFGTETINGHVLPQFRERNCIWHPQDIWQKRAEKVLREEQLERPAGRMRIFRTRIDRYESIANFWDYLWDGHGTFVTLCVMDEERLVDGFEINLAHEEGQRRAGMFLEQAYGDALDPKFSEEF